MHGVEHKCENKAWHVISRDMCRGDNDVDGPAVHGSIINEHNPKL